MTQYKHGISNAKRDWILILVLYGMIFFMLTSSYLMVNNYILSGHQCKEGTSDDGTTRQGNTAQADANATAR